MPDSGTGRDDISFEAEKSFVRAPLNSRVVSSGGPRDKGKGKAKESSLYGVPVDIQEALVLEDLLYVLMVRTCHPLSFLDAFVEHVATVCPPMRRESKEPMLPTTPIIPQMKTIL